MKCINCSNEAVGRSKYCGDSCKVLFNRKQKTPGVSVTVPGYVYIIHCTNTPYYKIGQTASMPLDRLSTLQTGCPYELELISAVHVKDSVMAEHKIHEYHDIQHVRGEWYELDTVDIETILTYLYQEQRKHWNDRTRKFEAIA